MKVWEPGELLPRVHPGVWSEVEPRTSESKEADPGRDRGQRELLRLETALREREQELLQALEDRETICQDLHDGVLQTLYAVGLGLETSKTFLREDPERAAEHLEHAIAQLNEAMREVRSLIAGLSFDVLNAEDLQATLENVAAKLTRSAPLCVSVRTERQAATQLSRTQRMQLIYIVQEAISNTIRHARATTGEIALVHENGSLQLTVADNGTGFEIDQMVPRGHGLANMAARARRVGASLRIQSCPGKGTLVTVRFPGSP